MGRYFKVIDKRKTDGHVEVLDNLRRTPDGMYEIIEEIVEDKECPCNGIPYKIEVEEWADLACIDEIYETKDFVAMCIDEEEYKEYNQ